MVKCDVSSIKSIERMTRRQPCGCTVLQSVCRLAQECSKQQFGKEVQGRSHGSLHGVWPVEFSNGRRGAIHECSDSLPDPVCLTASVSTVDPVTPKFQANEHAALATSLHRPPVPPTQHPALHCSDPLVDAVSRSDCTVSDGGTMSGGRVRKNVTGNDSGPH